MSGIIGNVNNPFAAIVGQGAAERGQVAFTLEHAKDLLPISSDYKEFLALAQQLAPSWDRKNQHKLRELLQAESGEKKCVCPSSALKAKRIKNVEKNNYAEADEEKAREARGKLQQTAKGNEALKFVDQLLTTIGQGLEIASKAIYSLGMASLCTDRAYLATEAGARACSKWRGESTFQKVTAIKKGQTELYLEMISKGFSHQEAALASNMLLSQARAGIAKETKQPVPVAPSVPSQPSSKEQKTDNTMLFLGLGALAILFLGQQK